MPQRNISQLHLSPQHLAVLQQLFATTVATSQVWAFGSRINGTAHDGSDLDLVLRNTPDLAHSVEGFFELKEALQNSCLPMLVDIHDWAHLPLAFHENIAADYVVMWDGGQLVDIGRNGA